MHHQKMHTKYILKPNGEARKPVAARGCDKLVSLTGIKVRRLAREQKEGDGIDIRSQNQEI